MSKKAEPKFEDLSAEEQRIILDKQIAEIRSDMQFVQKRVNQIQQGLDDLNNLNEKWKRIKNQDDSRQK